MSKDNRRKETPPKNVVDIDQLRSRRDRRKAQQKSLLGTLRGEKMQQPQGKPVAYREKQPPLHEQSGEPDRGGRQQDKPPRKLMGALVTACIVLSVAVMVALGMNLFVVRNIQVVGGVHYNRAQIIEAAGLRQGQSIFSVNAGAIRSELQSTPQLQLVSVDRQLPGTVVITVKETTPTLVVDYMNQFVTLDEELRVLSQEGSIPEGDYPLVTGMVVRTANQAEKIEVDDKLQLAALEAICAAFSTRSDSAQDDTYAPLYYITQIQLSDVDNLRLYTKNGYTVELGNAENMDRKALWVEQMVPMFIEKGYTGGTLDVAGSNSATFIPSQGQGVTETTTPAAGGETTPTQPSVTEPET